MGRKRRRAREARRALWPLLAVLALLVGAVAGYLYRELPDTAPHPPSARRGSHGVEVFGEILGPLDPGGTRVGVASPTAARELREKLEAAAGRAGGRVTEVGRRSGSLRLDLRVGEDRYPVEFWWTPAPAAKAPRLAIVIDDLGRSREEALAFLDLPLAVTPAVLPHLPMSEAVASLARERGREFLVHLPMQPQGYPTQNPGEGALLESMGEAELRRAVGHALASVPGAAGVNNHMGSRLTELEEPMAWLMDELASRGLYFLDSVTSARSVAARAANRAGIRWARRDVFLDNERDEEAIGRQLRRAMEAARAGDFAVAIAHPHAATLRALTRWAPALEAAGIKVVPLGEGLRRGDGV